MVREDRIHLNAKGYGKLAELLPVWLSESKGTYAKISRWRDYAAVPVVAI